MNTPENQFVKMVLTKSILEITRFKDRVKREDKSPEQGRISPTFLNELNSWKKPLEQLLNRPFFAEVVPELYEVWCLLEVRRMLLELGYARQLAAPNNHAYSG